MKLNLLFTFLLIGAGATTIAQPEGKVIDEIIAVVGDNVVLFSDIEAQKAQARQNGYSLDEMSTCIIMEELLFQNLLLHQAQVDSVEVTEAQIEGEIDRRMRYYLNILKSEEKFKEQFGRSVEEFKAEMVEPVREQLMAQSMQGQLTSDVKATPSDVRAYFNSIPSDSIPTVSSQVEVLHIVKKPLITPEDKKDVHDRLEKLRQEILGGADFETKAILYSEDPVSAARGGKLGMAERGSYVPEFEAVIWNLAEGQISEVFESPYGYHFARVNEIRGETIDVSHILFKHVISPKALSDSKAYLDSIYDVLKNDTLTFEEAAIKFSEDEDSKNSGGIIVNPFTNSSKFDMSQIGQIDQSLPFVLNKMEVGEVSKPVVMEMPDGTKAYRLIKLKTRTEPHRANLSQDYPMIQNAALSLMQQEALNEWVNKTLEKTFVRIAPAYQSCIFSHDWLKERMNN